MNPWWWGRQECTSPQVPSASFRRRRRWKHIVATCNHTHTPSHMCHSVKRCDECVVDVASRTIRPTPKTVLGNTWTLSFRVWSDYLTRNVFFEKRKAKKWSSHNLTNMRRPVSETLNSPRQLRGQKVVPSLSAIRKTLRCWGPTWLDRENVQLMWCSKCTRHVIYLQSALDYSCLNPCPWPRRTLEIWFVRWSTLDSGSRM